MIKILELFGGIGSPRIEQVEKFISVYDKEIKKIMGVS